MNTEEVGKIFSEYVKPMDDRGITPDVLDHDTCNKCGGICCKHMGCHFAPTDLKELSYEAVLSFMLKSKCVSIDWWEPTEEFGNQRVYFLRARNKRSDMIDPAWHGECVLFDEDKGCLIEDAYRPKGGLMLIPSDEQCDLKYTKLDCAKDWLEHQDILKEIVEKYYL